MTKLTAADGTNASRLCFGCMQFGGAADTAASHAMYALCREAGVNIFDTAHTYTGGASETYLGQLIGPERDKLIIATKAGYSGGSGRQNILAQFDESRSRLGLDTIDILYLHRWDPVTELEETFEALCDLRQSGKIRYIGVSNFAAWQVMKSQAVAERFGVRIDVLQPMYSLVKRQAEVELFPMARSEGLAVMPYSPLGAGLLTGKYLCGETGRLSQDTRYAARYGQSWMQDAAKALSQFATDRAIDPATLAVAWAAHHPAVAAPIISARNTTQLEPSLKALDLSLGDEDYATIEGMSPRPAPATDRLEEAKA